MGSTRRILGKIKNAGSEARVFRIVAGRIRLGNRIQLQQLASVPLNENERSIMKAITERFKSLRKKEGNRANFPQKIDALRVKAATLALSARLGRVIGRTPTAYQVLAVTALNYGLESRELTDQVTSMASTIKHYPREATWDGGCSNVDLAIKKVLPNGKSLLPELEKIIFKNHGALDSKRIAKKLGINFSSNVNQNTINSALQLFETMGLAKKLPESSAWGPSTSVWMHRAHKNPMIDYPNPMIDVMRKISEGKRYATEMHKLRIENRMVTRGKRKGMVKQRGSAEASFFDQSIHKAIRKLEKGGLVHVTSSTLTGAGSIATKVDFTPEGKKLWGKYIKEGSLPEELRRILLGEKEIKPKQS